MKKTCIAASMLLFMVAPLIGLSQVAQDESAVKIDYIDETETVKSKPDKRSSIKLNPLSFVRGDIPLYFEQTISDNISFEIGAGVTVFDYLGDGLFPIERNVTLGAADYELGYSFTANMRYYAQKYNYETEGLYFGLEYRHQTYNHKTDLHPSDFYTKYNDVRLLIGYIYIFDENAFIEPFAALGFRNIKYNSVTSAIATENNKALLPHFSLGVKIGISLR